MVLHLSGGLISFAVMGMFLNSWVMGEKMALFICYEIIQTSCATIELPILLDIYSVLFLSAVFMIGGSVFLFSSNYMAQEKHFTRFHLIVLSFIASMVLLIMSPSLISVLLGWDGLGVTSYLLVIYFQTHKSYNAGMVTALSNRIGDALIMISIALAGQSLFWNFSLGGWANFAMPGFFLGVMAMATCTKSAQIPFSAWLPAAMAAPTPVSSLVHSSTLVTAGVYVVFRLGFSFHTSWAQALLLALGSLTMLMAGVAALAESDMKKIVALSTLSQLGVMMLTLGFGALTAAIFHLLSHAFFKALLFMTVGAMIHSASDFQDMRKTSVLPFIFPLTLAFSLGANLSLCGLPFLSGFYSKDLCIELAAINTYNPILSLILYLGTALTAAYTARLIYLVLLSGEKSPAQAWARDNSWEMNSSMIVLYVLAVSGGGLMATLLFYCPLHLSLAFEMKNLTLSVIILSVSVFMWKRTTLLSPKSVPGPVFYLWGLPFFTSRLWTPSGLKVGAESRMVGDLMVHSRVFREAANSGGSMKSYIAMEGQSEQFLRGLALSFVILLSILVYLCVTNFFIFFKFKA